MLKLCDLSALAADESLQGKIPIIVNRCYISGRRKCMARGDEKRRRKEAAKNEDPKKREKRQREQGRKDVEQMRRRRRRHGGALP